MNEALAAQANARSDAEVLCTGCSHRLQDTAQRDMKVTAR